MSTHKVRSLFRIAQDRASSENERSVAERRAWEFLKKDPSLFRAIADEVLVEAAQGEHPPEWPSAAFFDVWVKMQAAASPAESAPPPRASSASSASQSSTARARRGQGASEAKQPRQEQPRASKNKEATPFAQFAQDQWEKVRQGATQWLDETVQGLASELNWTHQIGDIPVTIREKSKVITLQVNIPRELIERAYLNSDGDMSLFCGLVGQHVGDQLQDAFIEDEEDNFDDTDTAR